MAVKLFIIGLPGSGKSTLARHIVSYVAEKKNWTSKRFNDYDILNIMFHDPVEGQLFKAAGPEGGFNVIDISAFDTALQRLEAKIADYIASHTKTEDILIIEFARNDYWRAFRQFSKLFLQDAFFIYLGVGINICKERIRDRIANPVCPEDDYPISEYIFESYYHSDDGADVVLYLHNVFGVSEEHVLKFNNDCTREVAIEEIDPFIDRVLQYGEKHHKEAPPYGFSLASIPD